MATSKSIANITTLKGGGDPVATPPKKLTEAQLEAFSNYGGSTDVKVKAAYLAKKGLVGASQLLTDHPNLDSKDGIINAQSDWKTAAIGTMLNRARRLGLTTPTQLKASRDALVKSLEPRLQEAITHPVFNQIHPNFWQTFEGVLKDQYANENSPKPLNALQSSIAKN